MSGQRVYLPIRWWTIGFFIKLSKYEKSARDPSDAIGAVLILIYLYMKWKVPTRMFRNVSRVFNNHRDHQNPLGNGRGSAKPGGGAFPRKERSERSEGGGVNESETGLIIYGTSNC